VLDPVGVGASAFRKEVVEEILNHTQVTLIKGNAAELSCIAGLNEVASRGVDSGSGKLSDPEGLVKRLALREKCFVLLTGEIDYLTDGKLLYRIHNGHPLLGRITGSGCALGVTVAAGMAAACNEYKKQQRPSQSGTMVNANDLTLLRGALMG
jgi:thiamine-phosphate diphosphorylase/hydroxyethylthiazole kinase